MKRETIRKLLTTGLLACAASSSQAAIDAWGYTVDMKWTDAVFSQSTNINSSTKFTDTLLSWGYSGGLDDFVLNGSNPYYARSSLKITTPHGAGVISTGSSVSQVNIFRHTNNEIDASFADLKEATLSVSVNLTAYGSPVPVETLNKNFKVFFYETPNTGGTCAWGFCNDDIFAFVAMPQIYDEFVYGGNTYRFKYFQTSGPDAITEFSADICSAMSGGLLTTSCYGFKTLESAQTVLQFGFSVSAVPEPETYAMLLAGLSLVGAAARRRQRGVPRH